MKILKWIFIILTALILIFIGAFIIYENFFYEAELKKIKSELSEIDGVSVLDIWGHKDITLEEVSARIRIEGKGEIVLINLSSDVYDYPNSVYVKEIGGLSFTSISCSNSLGFGSSIDISENSDIGKLIGVKFDSPKEVIKNYDLILQAVKSLKRAPELNYFEHENYEEYLMVFQDKTKDINPIYNLVGVENLADFGRTLKWKKSNCN